MKVGVGNCGAVNTENGRPLQANTNSWSPFCPRLDIVTGFGLDTVGLEDAILQFWREYFLGICKISLASPLFTGNVSAGS